MSAALETLTSADIDALIADHGWSYAASFERAYWTCRAGWRAVPPAYGVSREGYLAGWERAVSHGADEWKGL